MKLFEFFFEFNHFISLYVEYNLIYALLKSWTSFVYHLVCQRRPAPGNLCFKLQTRVL